MNKKNLRVLIILTLLTIMTPSNLAESSINVTLYVNPPLRTTSPGETVSIDIKVDNATDLAGFDFALVYNSTILNGTQITEGPFLKSLGATYFNVFSFTDNYKPTQGLGVAYVISFLYSTPPGATGSGTLATINFTAKTVGDATLYFNTSYTLLYDSDLVDILFNTDDGTISVIAPDVAITNVTASPTTVLEGEIAEINVTAKNEGGKTETFYVTAYYDNNPIGTQTVTDLNPGASTKLTFNWNTLGVPAGEHIIKAEASIVPNETDIADNTYQDGTVKVIKPPTASFTYSPPSPTAGQLVTFDASTSTPNGGYITSYAWDFGDDDTTTTPNHAITHTYASEGTYNVNLTVTDSEGLTGSVQQAIGVGVALVHDIALINVTCSSNSTYSGSTLKLNVTAENQGDYWETFNVTAYYNGDTIETRTITSLPPKTATTINFTWDTTGVPIGTYTISANASVVPGETETADNTFTDGTVEMKSIVGDVDGDGDVDSMDLFTLAVAYGTETGDTLYNAACDFDGDGDVDSMDLFALAANYGT